MPYYPFNKNVQSTSHSSFQVFLSLKPTNSKHKFSSFSKQVKYYAIYSTCGHEIS